MHTDARSLPDNATVSADIAIVGTGPAGITLALELIGSGLSVLVVECGTFDQPEAYAEDIALWCESGIRDIEPHRCNRRVGGSSWWWGSHCRPLDPIDFEERSWVPNSGWPVTYDDMRPHYDRAMDVVELRSLPGETVAWDAREVPGHNCYPWGSVQFPMNRFGAVDFFQRAATFRLMPDVTVLTSATVSDVRLTRDLASVDHLVCRTPAGTTVRVQAGRYVLAAGGVENPSILLRATSQMAEGVGNANGVVGRYFQAHPTYDVNFRILTDPQYPRAMCLDWSRISIADTYLRRRALQGYGFAKIALSESVQREHRLLNGAGLLSSFHHTDPAAVWKELRGFVSEAGKGMPDLEAEQRLLNLCSRAQDLVRAMHMIRSGTHRLDHFFVLRFAAEQSPDRASRVLLTDERDAMGNLRPAIDWRINELDRESMKRTAELLGVAYESAGIAEDQLADPVMEPTWPRFMHGGFHYIGTTRMGVDPRTSVVDADGRVHGVGNLYATGCSVFPTCGHAPPTFTLVALASRLAGHLKAPATGRAARLIEAKPAAAVNGHA